MVGSYVIHLTPQAEAEYTALQRRAKGPLSRGDSTNAHVKKLRMVDELIDKIIPHNPCDPSRSLSGPLGNVYRVKKLRLRLCYIVSQELKRVTILYISKANRPRRAGDRRDPYKLLARSLSSGKFDKYFDDFGLPRP